MDIFSDPRQLSNIGYLASLILSGFLGIILFSRSKRISSRLFLAMVMAISLWTLSNYLTDNSTTLSGAMFWARVSIVGPIFLGPLLRQFFEIFPEEEQLYSRKNLLLNLLTTIPLLAMVPTSLNIQSIFITDEGIKYTPGILYILFFIHIVIYMLIAGAGVLKKYRISTGSARSQIVFISLGILLSLVPSLIFSLLLPLIGISSLAFLGPSTIPLLVFLVSFTLIRHRLFGIRWILSEVINMLTISIFPIVVFYFSYWLLLKLWGTLFGPESYFTAIIVSLFFIGTFPKIQTFTRSNVNKLLSSPEYSLLEIRDRFNTAISQVLDLHKIVETLAQNLLDAMAPERLAILITDRDRSNVIYSKQEKGSENVTLDSILPAITSSEKLGLKFPISLDEISFYISNAPQRNKPLLLSILQNLKSLDLNFIFKLSNGEDTLGYVILGEKTNRTGYSIQDVAFLESILVSSSIAIGRSLLYLDVQQFNLTLQQKVDSATKELTERNKELEDLYKNLEDIYRKEKDLMDVAGHEFRTPASILKNNLYLLKKRLEETTNATKDEKIQKYLDRLLEGTDRQIKLVNTFLESARIDNQRFEIQVEMSDLNDMIKTAVSEMKPFAEQKNLTINYNPPTQKIQAEIDSVRIREVVDNLLNNAVKYTKKGNIQPSLSETETSVIFSVKDTGIGIKDEDKALLFKKFSRVDNYIGGEEGSIVRPGGTGLGLFVAKTIIDSHGGKIRVESAPGVGSTFTFEIPKKQPSYVKRVQDIKSMVFSPSAQQPNTQAIPPSMLNKGDTQQTGNAVQTGTPPEKDPQIADDTKLKEKDLNTTQKPVSPTDPVQASDAVDNQETEVEK